MDSGFQCDLCFSKIGMVQNLRKHYKNSHGLSAEEIHTKTAGMREPKTICDACKGEIIRINRHVCPRPLPVSPPKGQRAAKKVCPQENIGMSSSKDQATQFQGSRCKGTELATYSVGTSLPSQNLEITACIPRILKNFEAYIVQPTLGGNSKRTAELYSGRMKSFLKHIAEWKGVDAPSRIIQVSSEEDYLPLPYPGEWIEKNYPIEDGQTSSRVQCIKAYIQFCDYLHHELTNNFAHFKQNQSDFYCRKEHINKQREIVSKLYGRQAVKRLETNVYAEQESQVPQEVIENIYNDYALCKERADIFCGLSEQMKNYKSLPLLCSEVRLRDWLMLEFFTQAAGKRPDTVLDLTWKELSCAELDGEVYVVETSECKAAKRHGSMPILVPKTLYKLMIDYCCEIYPFFKRLQLKNAKSDDERRQYQKIQLEDYVFPSDRGARMDRISRIIETLKRFVPESFGPWTISPNDYGRVCASNYQDSNNFGNPSHDPVFNDEAGPSGINLNEWTQKQRQGSQGKKKGDDEQHKEEKFLPTARQKLSQSEKTWLRETFDHLGRDTLLAKDIDDALKDEEFLRKFTVIRMRQQDDSIEKVKKVLQSSYRASKLQDQK